MSPEGSLIDCLELTRLGGQGVSERSATTQPKGAIYRRVVFGPTCPRSPVSSSGHRNGLGEQALTPHPGWQWPSTIQRAML